MLVLGGAGVVTIPACTTVACYRKYATSETEYLNISLLLLLSALNIGITIVFSMQRIW